MNSLDIMYNLGVAELPSPGRYTVFMKVGGFWQVVLEKTISTTNKGQNHLPIFFLRKFNIPFMDFNIKPDLKHKEVIFNYKNGLLIDKLKQRKDKNGWIGKIFYKERFLDYFVLRRK